MSQPTLPRMPKPVLHDLWRGRRLDKEGFENIANHPKTIKGLDAIKGVHEYTPFGMYGDNWMDDNLSYTNDAMYRDLNNTYRHFRGRPPQDAEMPMRTNNDLEQIHDVGDHMDDLHTRSRMHGNTILYRGVRDVGDTFGHHLASQNMTGAMVREHAPLSASPSKSVARNFSGVGSTRAFIHVLAPKGTPAVSTMWHGARGQEGDDDYNPDIHVGESEVILGRGGYYHVAHDSGPESAGARHIYLQYVGPDTRIHGKADLSNLEKPTAPRFDQNVGKLKEKTARDVVGDEAFEKFRNNGYDWDVSDPYHRMDWEEPSVDVNFTKRFGDEDPRSGLTHHVKFEGIDSTASYVTPDGSSVVVPNTTRDRRVPGKSYHGEGHEEYLDPDDVDVFDQSQEHLKQFPSLGAFHDHPDIVRENERRRIGYNGGF